LAGNQKVKTVKYQHYLSMRLGVLGAMASRTPRMPGLHRHLRMPSDPQSSQSGEAIRQRNQGIVRAC
jgi:hypothetical protein